MKTPNAFTLGLAWLVGRFPDSWKLVIGVLATWTLSLTVVFRGHLLGLVTDAAAASDLKAFMVALKTIVVLQLSRAALIGVRNISIGAYSEGAMRYLKKAAFERIGRAQIHDIRSLHSGEALSLLTNDLDRVRAFLAERLTDLLATPVTALIAAVYLGCVDWRLTGMMVLFVPCFLLISNFLSRKIPALASQHQSHLAQSSRLAKDAIRGVALVKAYALEKMLGQEFAFEIDQATDRVKKTVYIRALLDWISMSMAILPYVLLRTVGGGWAIAGRISPGAVVAFGDLFSNLTVPVNALPRLIGQVKADSISAQRIERILTLERERVGGTSSSSQGCNQAIVVKDLIFKYAGREIPTLKSIGFEVESGSTVAIVGLSGSGKSTLLQLLLGMYPHYSGEITIFGLPISQWNLESLRKCIAFVGQDTYLFPGSIGDNVRYGRLDATDQEVQSAAETAGVHEFVLGLAKGYSTQCGESGHSLSEGQRQRIALARTMIRDASIWLLDEPTSSLDSRLEDEVYRSLRLAAKGKTMLIVTHRFSIAQDADLILVLDGGTIVENGTHHALIDKNGLYHRMYLQSLERRAVVR